MVTYQFTFVEKNNNFAFIRLKWISFQYWQQKATNPSYEKVKAEQGVRHYSPHAVLFLGLLSDHVARRCDWTAAIWLLLLSWF